MIKLLPDVAELLAAISLIYSWVDMICLGLLYKSTQAGLIIDLGSGRIMTFVMTFVMTFIDICHDIWKYRRQTCVYQAELACCNCVLLYGSFKAKVRVFVEEQKKEHNGLPVFELEDGTKQIFSYFKYSLVVQYLMDEKGMDFNEICREESSLDQLYSEMIEWSKE